MPKINLNEVNPNRDRNGVNHDVEYCAMCGLYICGCGKPNSSSMERIREPKEKRIREPKEKRNGSES